MSPKCDFQSMILKFVQKMILKDDSKIRVYKNINFTFLEYNRRGKIR